MRTSVALAATLAVVSCGRGGDGVEPGGTPPAAEPPAHRASAPPPAADAPRVRLTTDQGTEVTVTVELARTPLTRRRGLMYRQYLGPDRGMLFLFDVQQVQSFWMKNTLVPLDMLFIDRDLTVVGIVENAEPLTTGPRSVGRPSVYVLEVVGGWSKAHAVSAGAKVRFENVTR